MANYVLYTRENGDELKLKINSGRAVELEERFGASIPDKLKEIDRIGVAAEFVAAAVPDGDYDSRKKTALAIFDEMTAAGKTIQDYQFLISDLLVKAGFLNGKAVETQKELIKRAQDASEKLLADGMTASQS